MRRLALRVERRRLLSVMIAIAFCLSAMLGLLVASSSDRTDTAYREDTTVTDATPMRMLALTSHDPILIDGNAGFIGLITSTGVTGGSGTASNPYIIEGWEISSFPSNGIEIRNVDVCFVVQNCYVHDGVGGEWEQAAIYLNQSSNGSIRNCTCSSNSLGYGIRLYSSDSNSLIDNACTDSWYGIYLWDSNGNSIVDNNCSGNGDGIRVWDSDSNSVIDNTCSSNYGDGIRIHGVTSIDNSIVDNTCFLNSVCGICLYSSDSCSLANNTCSNNEYGIGMYRADGNRLWENTIANNGGAGVLLTKDGSSSDNIFWHNNFVNNTPQAEAHGYPNTWDNGSHEGGNYWSNYTGQDANGDGRGDSPYVIDGQNIDRYPLMAPWTPSQELPDEPKKGIETSMIYALSIAAVVIIVVVAILVMRRKKEPDQFGAGAEEPPTAPPGT